MDPRTTSHRPTRGEEPVPIAGRFSYNAALDNHEIPRSYAVGELELYTFGGDDGRPPTYVLLNAEQFGKDYFNAVYLLDDGNSVVAHYVAGIPKDGALLYLHAFPTNPLGLTRPDNGREIDYGTWQLGPRRAYHLKIRRI